MKTSIDNPAARAKARTTLARRKNYGFEKKQRENRKKQKQAAKLERKLERQKNKEGGGETTGPEPSAPTSEETPAGEEVAGLAD